MPDSQANLSAPAPYNPLALVEEDYACGVLRLVWDVNRQTKERTLLCGALELVPQEVPPPLDGAERHTTLSGSHFLYAVDRVVSLHDGLHWLELARNGTMVRPDATGAIGPPRVGSPMFVESAFDEQPPSPLLATTSRVVPFVADWQNDVRVRHLIARTFRIEQLWTVEELEAALAWLKADSHFDFRDFPEYWGSIHLIAPNPIFRRFSTRLDRSSGRPELVLAVELRAGKSVSGLEFELESKGPTGTVFIVRRCLEHPIERIQLPGEPQEPYERVFDVRRGLLYDFGPFVYGGDWSMSMTLNLMSETRRVSVQLADGSPGDYEVPLSGGLTQTMEMGPATQKRPALDRLHAEQVAREKRGEGKAAQRWFRDQVGDAVAELRELVRNVSSRLWVADPYFGGDDVHRILLAVQNPDVPVRVLAGGDHLRKRKVAEREEGDYLEQRIAEARGSGRMNPLAVRVMGGGSSPPLHDRFLIVDGNLWLLGSSLHAFGSRGTMLLKVPDPTPVLDALETIWTDSEDFSAWHSRRQNSRGLNERQR